MLKYKVIAMELKKRIRDKTYINIDRPIPNENALSKEFECSRMTIRKALSLLENEGIIYKKQGSGSYIRELVKETKRINLCNTDLAGLSQSIGIEKNIKNKLISFKIIFSNEQISQKLNINLNSPVYEIIRIRFIDNIPSVYERTYMNALLITGVTEDVLKNSIYTYIEDTLKLKIHSSNKTIRADKSNATDIEYLNLTECEPVLETEQIAYLLNGEPFEFSFSRHRYDKFEFSSFTLRK